MARLSALGLLAFFSLAGLAHADESPETFFELKIRPVLVSDCLPCHGGKKISSGLKVDSREALIKGGDRGPAVVAGDPEGSLLIQAIRQTHDEVKMPPKRRLSEETIGGLREMGRRRGASGREASSASRWPAQGTSAPRHWAFERIKAVEPPPDPTGWSEPADRSVHLGQAPGGRLATRATAPTKASCSAVSRST